MVATLYVFSALMLQQATSWDLRSMLHSMSTLALAVVVILFILSIYSFGVMIDRALMYSAARKQSRVFVQQVAGALKDGKLDEAIAIAERNKKSHIAKVVATGLSEFQSASQQVSDSDVIDAAKRGLERSVAIVHAEMKRGLSALATIGSTAPFVGLFGTVVGMSPPSGLTTTSPIKWKPSTSRWTTPPWSSSTTSSCAVAPESNRPWPISHKPDLRWRPPTLFLWPTSCSYFSSSSWWSPPCCRKLIRWI